jgi:hypothetical protein
LLLRNFSWDKAAVTALEAFEKIATEDTGIAQMLPEALISSRKLPEQSPQLYPKKNYPLAAAPFLSDVPGRNA